MLFDDIDPKQFPLRVGDRVLIIKNANGARLPRAEQITITKAVNHGEGYYEGETRTGELIVDLNRQQLKKK